MNLFYKESKSNIFFFLGGGGGGERVRLSKCVSEFFTKNPNLKEEKLFVCVGGRIFFWWGGGGRLE